MCNVNLSWAKENISKNLLFFRNGVEGTCEIPLESVSAVMPMHTSDFIVRVFVKNPQKYGEAQAAFKAFLQRDAPECIESTFPS